MWQSWMGWTALKESVFGVILVRIFHAFSRIRTEYKVSLRIQSEWGKMREKCGPEKLPLWTLFTLRWKKPLRKWHTFWMASCLICYFIVILFYIKRMWLLLRNLTTVSLLKSKFSGKFQRFNAIDGNIEMLKNS